MAIVIPDPQYVLRGVAGEAFGRTYHLLSPTVVGRTPECDISIDASGLSRMHARLRPTRDGLEIEDLRSTNGSFLNGQRITAGTARPGDEIAFDQLRFRVFAASVRQENAPPAPALGRERPSRGWIGWAILGVGVIGIVAVLALSPGA